MEMEAAGIFKLQSCPLLGAGSTWKRPSDSPLSLFKTSVSHICVKANKSGFLLKIAPIAIHRQGRVPLGASCCLKNPRAASTLQTESLSASLKEASILQLSEASNLQKNSQEVVPYLNSRCIYLVGMMGSGKTTVGKIISKELGYSFSDSDNLVEEALGAASVAQIFQEHSESFFRDNESKVLEDLSAMRRVVVATGGGVVIRPINWKHMKHGVTVWIDVPLDALARRITAVGTNSRPLLHDECGDPYTKVFKRLTMLWDERGEAYENADARVSLQNIAAKAGHEDVSIISPTAIAIEALERIQDFLTFQKQI